MYKNVSIFFFTPHLLKKGSFVDQNNVYNCYNIFTQHRKGMTNGYLFIYLYLSLYLQQTRVNSDLTIPFFYQTNVVFIYILVRRKWIFREQLHVIAQCLLHIKSLRKMVLCDVFATINEGRVKPVITVYALVANKV